MTGVPRRVESSLLVLEEFAEPTRFGEPAGRTWRPGDRAPLARAAVRRAATERPELFAVEFETLPFSPEEPWFQEVVARYEREYERIKTHRDGEAAREQARLRAEMAEQDRSQPDLERRHKRQEKEREKRLQAAKTEQERRIIENELEFMRGR